MSKADSMTDAELGRLIDNIIERTPMVVDIGFAVRSLFLNQDDYKRGRQDERADVAAWLESEAGQLCVGPASENIAEGKHVGAAQRKPAGHDGDGTEDT